MSDVFKVSRKTAYFEVGFVEKYDGALYEQPLSTYAPFCVKIARIRVQRLQKPRSCLPCENRNYLEFKTYVRVLMFSKFCRKSPIRA